MWRRIVSLIVKELRTLMRDPKSRFVVIGPPLIQLFIFSYAATYDHSGKTFRNKPEYETCPILESVGISSQKLLCKYYLCHCCTGKPVLMGYTAFL